MFEKNQNSGGMNMKLLRQICILISLVSINLSGCDKVAELLPGASEDGKQAENNTVEEENYVQGPLLVILDDQEMLSEQIREAKNSGDMMTVKVLFEEFEAMEADFNAGFEAVQGELTSAEATEISRRHRDIIRELH
jgi:hypothetical protein